MGRRFGSIKLRPNKHTPRYLSASYPTPIEARELDPTLPERQSRNFPLTAEVEARAWLEAARKKIDAGAWQPDRDVKRRERASALTFGEYFPEWLAARTRSDGEYLTCWGPGLLRLGAIMSFGGYCVSRPGLLRLGAVVG